MLLVKARLNNIEFNVLILLSKDYHQAVADCTETIYWDDEIYVIDGYYNRGRAYQALGDYQKADRDFMRFLSLNSR